MLVLERQIGQEIIIGNEVIRIKVLRVGGNGIRLGIEAPPSFSIHRAEIFEKIKNGIDKNKATTGRTISGEINGEINGNY